MSAAADQSNPDLQSPQTDSGSPGWTHSVFFRSHAPRLEALIRSRLSRRLQARVDPADIVQSAFRSFFLRPVPPAATPTAVEDLWPLLAEIAVRKLSQQVRRHTAQRRSVDADISSGNETASTAAGPEEVASISEVIEMASQALDDPARTAFALRLEGYEILEIAERMQISERTVRRHLSAAKEVLKRLLDSEPALPAGMPAISTIASLPTTLSFSDYRLHQWIGDGAVGNVYRATEKSTGRSVAVKFIKKAFRFHPQAGASFRHEVQIVAQLDHPGILRIMGLGRTPNQGDFLVMDWAPGGDLARHTAAHRSSLKDIHGWALEIANALQHAHQHGVIHCDLKPSNVLIGTAGQLQLCDFGMARQLAGWSGDGAAHGGTPAFIAPELVDPSWGPIGPWTDVFGLGGILFNLLTGCPLYEGGTLDAILTNIISRDPISWPRSLQSSVPREWKILCDKLLAKNVSARVPDMIAARQAIENLPIPPDDVTS